jgi:hypothetical protein
MCIITEAVSKWSKYRFIQTVFSFYRQDRSALGEEIIALCDPQSVLLMERAGNCLRKVNGSPMTQAGSICYINIPECGAISQRNPKNYYREPAVTTPRPKVA